LTIRPPLATDPPNVLRLHIEYVCQLEHLGRATAVAEQVVIFTGPTTAIASNTTIYTAANGDQLFATWTGTSTTIGPDAAFSGPETYAGGTGRFVDASGSAWISGTASFVTNTGQFTVEGTLGY
jgi:hydroxyethylthiazole kinase-like sugar kinase family protein